MFSSNDRTCDLIRGPITPSLEQCPKKQTQGKNTCVKFEMTFVQHINILAIHIPVSTSTEKPTTPNMTPISKAPDGKYSV